ncbi:MAG: hypothetical protein WBS24_01995 [Terriglobales bacterium]
MRFRSKIIGSIVVLSLALFTAAAFCEDMPATTAPAQTSTVAAGDPLLQLLVAKGVLNADEAKSLGGTPAEQRAKLLALLRAKGILSATDYEDLTMPSASEQVAPNLVASTTPILPAAVMQKEPGPVTTPPPVAPPAVVAAIAPLRVLPVDPPKKDGLNAAFKMGPVKMTPYGFLKATGVYDTSNPNGDDMPFPGLFLGTTSILNTGPTEDPEFHLKARSSRIGANFEWPDISPKVTLTGRIEADFEGNFSEVDNRDVSSIRSSMLSFRQAWVRMDYAASDKTDVYFEGGQDWTLFGSSALPNLLETTALGYWYGDIYERSPQFQFGLVQKVGDSSRNFKIAPTFAIMMPSTGQIEKLGSLGLAGQIGQGEREGADSGRPEFEGRLALQFQLDKAPAVAPAQLFWAGFRGKRTSIVPGTAMASGPAAYEAAFPNGFTTSSKMYGNQFGVQLPTRWFTLVASAYRGGDLRFFFGGQVNTFFTDLGGLSNGVTYVPLDGVTSASGTPQLACQGTWDAGTGTCSGSIVVAPQRPIRAFGGFVNLGLPLSRWFNANPKGHNAGWQLYLDAGKDQVVHRDLTNAFLTGEGALPLLMGKMGALTLYYKYNPYITFGFEQSIYATRLDPGVTGLAYTIAGRTSNEWQDHRTEFGPIFTF